LKAISSERRERKVYSVALRDEIRTWVLIQGKSQRAAAQHFGLSRNTVAKLLQEEKASNVRQYQRQAPKITPVRDLALPHIEGWLKENEWLERWAPKQRWTAHRMWMELRKLGISIGESTVRMYVQEKRKPAKSAFVPLDFAPGERAEFDFGEAMVTIKGQLLKVPSPFWPPPLLWSHVCGVLPHPTARRLPAGAASCLRVLGRRAPHGRL
jgi:transposase